MSTVESFDDYVSARWPRLVRTVVLLGADVHTAEDVVQSALARCCFRWDRITQTRDPDAYVHRVIINGFIDGRRRFWHRETPTEKMPAGLADDSSDRVGDRDLVHGALLRLPTAQRQVVVLRFFADLSEQQTADALNVAVGTVKSRTSRALTALAADSHLIDAVKGEPS